MVAVCGQRRRVMEPRIQYAQTKDGVSIAFWTLGEGEPLVHTPNHPLSHVELEWRFPERRRWYEDLSRGRKLIRYDSRGSGLSERNVEECPLEALVQDLEAVVDRLRLERFALLGYFMTGTVAVAYAARHPERVSHLALWCAPARPAVVLSGPRADAMRQLAQTDWEGFTLTFAHWAGGWSEGEAARRFAAFIRECVSPEELLLAYDAMSEHDVTTLLPQVRAPTLVFQRRQLSWLPVDVARDVASKIPDARMALLDGDSMTPYLGDMESVIAAINEFLGEDEEAAPKAESPEPGAFRTILFTDVEGSTALTDRLGDARARELLREHERMVREALKSHGGAEVKTLGDGFMASFSSATKALECAIAMQRACAEHNKGAAEPIRVRIGLNAGEPIAEDDDLYGTAVNLAARIAAKAEGGEILTSDTVRGLVAGKKFLFSDRGETAMRGFEDPVRLFELRWQGED